MNIGSPDLVRMHDDLVHELHGQLPTLLGNVFVFRMGDFQALLGDTFQVSQGITQILAIVELLFRFIDLLIFLESGTTNLRRRATHLGRLGQKAYIAKKSPNFLGQANPELISLDVQNPPNLVNFVRVMGVGDQNHGHTLGSLKGKPNILE